MQKDFTYQQKSADDMMKFLKKNNISSEVYDELKKARESKLETPKHFDIADIDTLMTLD